MEQEVTGVLYIVPRPLENSVDSTLLGGSTLSIQRTFERTVFLTKGDCYYIIGNFKIDSGTIAPQIQRKLFVIPNRSLEKMVMDHDKFHRVTLQFQILQVLVALHVAFTHHASPACSGSSNIFF